MQAMCCWLTYQFCLFYSRVVIHIVSEVSDVDRFEMLERYVKVELKL